MMSFFHGAASGHSAVLSTPTLTFKPPGKAARGGSYVSFHQRPGRARGGGHIRRRRAQLRARQGTIGIAMPTRSSARWIYDGNSIVEQFEAAGYATDLQYAKDDIPNQLAQIENMITKGVDVLVIAAIDGTTLSNALENAAASGIKAIAYDRLIHDSANVDYDATFDNFKVGVQQAESLVAGLNERFPDQKPWNVELFGGSPDDNKAFFFYDGAMSVLQPMIDAGDMVIGSGQMGMDVAGTLRWDGAVAQARMDYLLSANYGDRQVHGVLSPYDGLSIGILLRSRAWATARAICRCPSSRGKTPRFRRSSR
jgi:putative multiple sugar transport system substrate-binding protein